MKLVLDKCVVRSWKRSDAPSLAVHANNHKIWINLRDAFPFPYTKSDARKFIKMARSMKPETYFAIEVDGEAVGAIGFSLHQDVERVSAEIGYWLSEQYWGRGITTEALKALTQYAITGHNLTRIYAVPFEWNSASFRVLEKAGYRLECRMRKSAIKEGKIVNQLQYAYVVGDDS
jgi:ribosomal-protein-alanine N-acetyltransferase